MMNFSLAIPTWVNVKRIKGKPAYHPFSTHISAFSVHDDDFSGKMPSLPPSLPPFLPPSRLRAHTDEQATSRSCGGDDGGMRAICRKSTGIAAPRAL